MTLPRGLPRGFAAARARQTQTRVSVIRARLAGLRAAPKLHPRVSGVRKVRLLSALMGVVVIFGGASARASTYIATSIDTMKESADATDRPMTPAQIDQDVGQLAKLNPTYITVNTPMDKVARYREWVQAIRAHGLKVWHRPFGYEYPASLTDT